MYIECNGLYSIHKTDHSLHSYISIIYVLYHYLTNMSTHIEESQIPSGSVPITWLTQYLDQKNGVSQGRN